VRKNKGDTQTRTSGGIKAHGPRRCRQMRGKGKKETQVIMVIGGKGSVIVTGSQRKTYNGEEKKMDQRWGKATIFPGVT